MKDWETLWKMTSTEYNLTKNLILAKYPEIKYFRINDTTKVSLEKLNLYDALKTLYFDGYVNGKVNWVENNVNFLYEKENYDVHYLPDNWDKYEDWETYCLYAIKDGVLFKDFTTECRNLFRKECYKTFCYDPKTNIMNELEGESPLIFSVHYDTDSCTKQEWEDAVKNCKNRIDLW